MIRHIALREVREQVRQPAMLGLCVALYALVAAVVLLALGLLAAIDTPAQQATVASLAGTDAATFLSTATTGCLLAFDFLLYSQYLGFVGVIAGHSFLHDRQLGTLPFLLLAPVSRGTLLLGKAVGAWLPITALTVGYGAGMGAVLARLDVGSTDGALAAQATGWWLALLVAGPAWGGFVAVTTAVTSSVAREVRLAQQAVWFVVFFVQLAVALLVTGNLGSAAGQGMAAILAVVAGTGVGWIGRFALDDVRR